MGPIRALAHQLGVRLPVLVLGLAVAGMMSAGSVSASTSPDPPGKPSPPATTTPAPRPSAPAPALPAPKKPLRRAGSAADCLMVFGGLSSDHPDARPSSISPNFTIMLTSTTSCDIGPTPLYIEIFDATTGTLVGETGTGTSLTVPVSQALPTTHAYIAYLELWSGTFPPPPSSVFGVSVTIYLTWENIPLNFVVSLSGPQATPAGQPGTFTATSNEDVGPTPYWIEIFDEGTGALLAQCPSGTTCSVSYLPSMRGSNLVAFISFFSSALPPSGTIVNSAVLSTIQTTPIT